MTSLASSARAALFIALMVVLGACVSPRERAAEEIPDVPYDLLGPASTTTEPPPEVEGGFELDLYFLAEEDDTLWRVTRPREQAPEIQEALELLVAGPTESESEILAVRARLSESLNPVAGQPTGGLLSITVADEAQFRDNTNNRLATQVIVCTMTQFASVDAIELRDTAGPIPLSGIDSESIGEIGRRSNYRDCDAGDLTEFAESGTDDTAELEGEDNPEEQEE
ncbi:MAG: GerMN domain-containing protein [Acidimicrobiales bacterium]|nr:GerMN domain-containing protein [Acidimicrobiales bacterium]